jgi:hypothetical protein
MKLKAFLTIFIVLFSGIAINMGHEEDISSITFVYPEEYGLISGNITISADVASRVDGNYYLSNVLFKYSVDGSDEKTIGICDESVNPARGEDAGLVNRTIDWDTSALDGRYILEGVASYYYASPLPDSEISDEKENNKKYGKYSLLGISFLKYDLKSESNTPESPGEMPDTKMKSENIVIYISNGTKKPDIDILGISIGTGTLENILTIHAEVEDPFEDMVNKVKFE